MTGEAIRLAPERIAARDQARPHPTELVHIRDLRLHYKMSAGTSGSLDE